MRQLFSLPVGALQSEWPAQMQLDARVGWREARGGLVPVPGAVVAVEWMEGGHGNS